jgi:hypothetical protein
VHGWLAGGNGTSWSPALRLSPEHDVGPEGSDAVVYEQQPSTAIPAMPPATRCWTTQNGTLPRRQPRREFRQVPTMMGTGKPFRGPAPLVLAGVARP